MKELTKQDYKYIKTRTKSNTSAHNKRWEDMYIDRGNKGKRIKISEGIVFHRA